MEKKQEEFLGHIVIKSFFSGSKSDGYIAYLFTDTLKYYKLGREGVYTPADDFFFHFNRKYVQATGNLFQDRILTITNIVEIDDPFDNRPIFAGNLKE